MPDFPRSPGGMERATANVLARVRQLQTALERHDRARIVEIVRQLSSSRAPLADQWLQLSQIAAHNGEIGLALEAIELFIEHANGGAAALYQKAALLAMVGSWSEALALLRSLPEDVPDPASYAYTRGSAALYVGEADEARRYLEKASRLHPQWGSPWVSLALLADFAHDAELADHVIAAEPAMQRALPIERGSYLYALAKVYADRRETARAFDAFSRGAQLFRQQFGYSRGQDRAAANAAIEGYDPGRVGTLAGRQNQPTGRAIFVTGLPRSGTTLAEQILTSHSAVSDGGEIYRLGLLAKEVGGPSCPAVETYIARGMAPDAARLWNHWLAERFPRPGRVVDKTIGNSRLLGLAATLLPEAPLIWMTRDPLDCAWSCFHTRFAGEAPWSYDLEDIAFHFRLERELLTRWQDVLGARLLVVPYEELTGQPDLWIRRMLRHCGLREEPQVFAPHENKRAVTTASAMQVRQPINCKAIGSAEPYRKYLEPFVAAYCA